MRPIKVANLRRTVTNEPADRDEPALGKLGGRAASGNNKLVAIIAVRRA